MLHIFGQTESEILIHHITSPLAVHTQTFTIYYVIIIIIITMLHLFTTEGYLQFHVKKEYLIHMLYGLQSAVRGTTTPLIISCTEELAQHCLIF